MGAGGLDYRERPGKHTRYIIKHPHERVRFKHQRVPGGRYKRHQWLISPRCSLQVLLPLIQGTVWTLALSGWKFWNRNASLSGQTVGSRIRRWWYDVNNWKLPPKWTKSPQLASQVEEVSKPLRLLSFAILMVTVPLTLLEFLKFYEAQFSNAGSD